MTDVSKIVKQVFDEAVATNKVSRYRVSQNGGHVAYYTSKSEAMGHAKRLKQADKTDSIRVAHIRLNPSKTDDYMRHVALGEGVKKPSKNEMIAVIFTGARMKNIAENTLIFQGVPGDINDSHTHGGYSSVRSKKNNTIGAVEHHVPKNKKAKGYEGKKLYTAHYFYKNNHPEALGRHPTKEDAEKAIHKHHAAAHSLLKKAREEVKDMENHLHEATKSVHPDHIQRAYERNEDNNYHGKNVELLAKHYGSKEDHARAKAINKRHEARGHISDSDYAERSVLHDKLYDKHRKAWNKAFRKANPLDEAHAGGSKRTTHITGRGRVIPHIEPIKGHEMKARLDSIAKAYGKKKPVKEETIMEGKIPLKCNECGHHFKKTPRGVEAKCPKCKGYDTEFDYSYGGPKQQAAALRKTIVREGLTPKVAKIIEAVNKRAAERSDIEDQAKHHIANKQPGYKAKQKGRVKRYGAKTASWMDKFDKGLA